VHNHDKHECRGSDDPSLLPTQSFVDKKKLSSTAVGRGSRLKGVIADQDAAGDLQQEQVGGKSSKLTAQNHAIGSNRMV